MQHLSLIMLITTSFAISPNTSRGIDPIRPTQEDADVIRALIIEMVSGKNKMWGLEPNKPQFVLDASSPIHPPCIPRTHHLEKKFVVWDKPIQGKAVEDSIKRNMDKLAGQQRRISYKDLKFGSDIVVDDLTNVNLGDYPSRTNLNFLDKYPSAGGWLSAYLPGYDRKNNSSFVLGMIGPSAHSATVVAFLKKTQNGWKVNWIRYVYYS